MFNKRGEISTIVILGTLVVVSVAALISSTSTNRRNTTGTQAAGTCRNNPEAPPDGGFTWVASCSSTCTTNSDCPKNTSDPGNVNPETSNWCYGFAEGARCLQLQKGSVTTATRNEGASTTTTTGQSNTTASTPCDKAEGCGGVCNGSLNNGCGYGGCRAWEQCVNNTCIDTTNLGTQPAGSNACQALASAGSAQNVRSSVQSNTIIQQNQNTNTNTNTNTQQPVQTPTTAPQSNTGSRVTPDPTVTPTRAPLPNGTQCKYGSDCQSGCCAGNYCSASSSCQNSCARPGQIRCQGTNICADSREDCEALSKPLTPTPTRTTVYIPFGGTNNTPTPTPSKIIIQSSGTAYQKSCIQNGQLKWEEGCIYYDAGNEYLNRFLDFVTFWD